MNESQKLISDECNKVKEMLLAKNRAYGDSALNPIRCFSKADAEEQINVRLDDKISRLMRGGSTDTEDVEFDLIGYIILKRVKRKMNQNEQGSRKA